MVELSMSRAIHFVPRGRLFRTVMVRNLQSHRSLVRCQDWSFRPTVALGDRRSAFSWSGTPQCPLRGSAQPSMDSPRHFEVPRI